MSRPGRPGAFEAPGDLGADEVRRAAAAFLDARTRVRAANRRFRASAAWKGVESDPGRHYPAVREWERWIDLVVSAEADAERRLAAAVLSACGRADIVHRLADPPHGWKPCAAKIGRTLFVVAPGRDDKPTPRVHVLDAAAVCAFDPLESPADDLRRTRRMGAGAHRLRPGMLPRRPRRPRLRRRPPRHD